MAKSITQSTVLTEVEVAAIEWLMGERKWTRSNALAELIRESPTLQYAIGHLAKNGPKVSAEVSTPQA